MKYIREQKVEDNFRLPVFWQTPCCTFALSPWSSTMWVCVATQSIAYALAQGKALLQGWHLCVSLVCLANVPAFVRWFWCNTLLYLL